MNTNDLKILWVDDEDDIVEMAKDVIKMAGYTPITANNVKSGIELYKQNIEDLVLVLSDYMMPEMNGIEFRKATLEIDNSVSFGIISAYVTKQMALDALDLNICGFYDKPFNIDKMLEVIKKKSEERAQNIIENRMIENTFYQEAMELLNEIEEKLIALDNDRANSELINSIARVLHTLKGSSGCLSTNIITKYVHKYEDLFLIIKKGGIQISNKLYEILFRGFDRIKELVSCIPQKKLKNYKLDDLIIELKYEENLVENTVEEPKIKNKVEVKVKDSISVPIYLLDELENYSGEITVIKNMIIKIIRNLEIKFIEDKEIHNLSELFEEMSKINSTIQNKINEICKVPISLIFRPLNRIIRDISTELNKKIQLNIEGDTIRVANSISEICSNCIIHLIRNSADHGIEMPEERTKLKKPLQGSINIKCVEDNNDFILNIKDDGRGIDTIKIKEKALEKNLYSIDELEKMSEKEIFEIIFSAGFSTASKVTDISGRGVGMDMVKTSVESIGGKLTIDSTLNKGTSFTLRLPKPKSVTIINSLIVEINRKIFAIPEDNIEIIVRVDSKKFSENLNYIYNQKVFIHNNKMYPLIELDKLLNLNVEHIENNDKKDFYEILLIKIENLLFALIIDNIIDSEEIVLKKIPNFINRSGFFSGATFMADGSVGLIIDIKKIAMQSGMNAIQKKNEAEKNAVNIVKSNYLLTKIDQKSVYGFPLEYIFRIEEIYKNNIKLSGELQVINYREQLMIIQNVSNILGLTDGSKMLNEKINVVVVKENNQYYGFEVNEVIDIVENFNPIDNTVSDRLGIIGNLNLNNKNVAILDVKNIMSKVNSK